MSDSCDSVSNFPKRVRFYRDRVKKLKPSRKSKKHRRRSKRSKRKLWRPTSRRKSCYDKDECFEEECFEEEECFSNHDSECSNDSGEYFGSDFDFEFVEEPIKKTKTIVDQKYSQINFNKKLPLIYKGIQFKK